jgi:hypothetical protein
METMYDLPANVDSTGAPPLPGIGQMDLMTAAVQAATAHRRDGDQTVAAHLGTMPLLARLREFRGLRRSVGAQAMVPEWAVAVARSRR